MANDPKIPRIPKSLKTDLNQVNEQLQDIATKIGRIGDLGNSFNINTKPMDDLARKYADLAKINKKWADTIRERVISEKRLLNDVKEQRKVLTQLRNEQKGANRLQLDAEKEIRKLLVKQQGLRASGTAAQKKAVAEELAQQRKLARQHEKTANLKGQALSQEAKKLREQEKQLDSLEGKWSMIAKLAGNEVLGALDKLGKSLLALGIDAVFASLNLVKGGVEKIYDLMQRTVKATGEFNEGLGATGSNLKSLQQEGWKLEGTLRGLGDFELGIGLKELEQATHAFGFADKELSKFRETAVLAGKAMGLGSQTAGEMARTFKLMGVSQKEIATQFAEISDAADDAGVPVADFGKEINSVKGFMVSFGKAGKKTFLESAAFAKKLGVSMQSLEKFTEMTDSFEQTATAAAKMNTVFGTSINSMELMLEQDPSKRLEMVRKQFKEQGKSWEGMNRQERKFFAQTMNLSEEEAAAVLENNMTLDEFHKKREREKKSEAAAQKQIQQGLLKTVSTLNNWSATFDKITKSFMPLLKPLTDFLGITVKIDKKTGEVSSDWTSFSKRVDQVVKRIKDFFDMMMGNEKVQALLSKITEDFKSIFGFLVDDGPEGKKNMEEIGKTISNVAQFAMDFYDAIKSAFKMVWDNRDKILGVFNFIVKHHKIILGIWGAAKVGGFLFSAAKGVKGLIGLLGGGKTLVAAFKAFGSILAPVGKAVGAALSAATKAIGGFVSQIGKAAFSAGQMVARAGAWIAGPAVAGAVGYAIGTVANNVTFGGKRVGDILVDAALAFKDNVVIMVEDAWEAIKALITKMAGKVGLEGMLPDFLKPSTGQSVLSKYGMGGDVGAQVMEKIKKAGAGQLSEKEMGSLGTRLSQLRGSELNRVLEQAGVQDPSGLAAQLRGKSAIKNYAQEAVNPYVAALAAGGQGMDFNKSWVGLDTKGVGAGMAAPVNLLESGYESVMSTVGEAGADVKQGFQGEREKKNYAKKEKEAAKAAGKEGVLVTAGDIYLDGNLVGRTLARAGYTTK